MNPNDIKLKYSSQLTDEDKQFIKDNPDKFNDEDREAWKDVLGSDTPEEPTDPTPPTPNEPSDPPTPPADPNAGEPSGTPAVPQAAEPAKPSGYVFQSEEEAKAFVQKALAEEKQKAIDAAQTPEEKKWVEDNWKPKNWNEGIKTTADVVIQMIEERQKLRNQQIEEHNKKVEADWQALRTENKLPDIRNQDGTENPEGITLQNAIINIGAKYGKKNFKDAYEVYKTIPKEFGGGYEPKAATPAPADPPTDPKPATPAPEVTPSQAASILAKQKSEAAKKAAAKVGGQNPGTNAAKGAGALKPMSYEEMRSKSPSKLLREAVQG